VAGLVPHLPWTWQNQKNKSQVPILTKFTAIVLCTADTDHTIPMRHVSKTQGLLTAQLEVGQWCGVHGNSGKHKGSIDHNCEYHSWQLGSFFVMKLIFFSMMETVEFKALLTHNLFCSSHFLHQQYVL
ncbi:hypothetical protein EI555_020382, partial [Monodon monoceros]